MTDESVTDEQQARTEFERAMRGCRKKVARWKDNGRQLHDIVSSPEWYRGKDPLPEPTEGEMQALREHIIAHINQGPVTDDDDK